MLIVESGLEKKPRRGTKRKLLVREWCLLEEETTVVIEKTGNLGSDYKVFTNGKEVESCWTMIWLF